MKIYLSEYLNYKIKLHFKYSISKHKNINHIIDNGNILGGKTSCLFNSEEK